MVRLVSLLVIAGLQGCFWVSKDSQDARTSDLDQDGILDVDDCTPTVASDVNGIAFFVDVDGDGDRKSVV